MPTGAENAPPPTERLYRRLKLEQLPYPSVWMHCGNRASSDIVFAIDAARGVLQDEAARKTQFSVAYVRYVALAWC